VGWEVEERAGGKVVDKGGDGDGEVVDEERAGGEVVDNGGHGDGEVVDEERAGGEVVDNGGDRDGEVVDEERGEEAMECMEGNGRVIATFDKSRPCLAWILALRKRISKPLSKARTRNSMKATTSYLQLRSACTQWLAVITRLARNFKRECYLAACGFSLLSVMATAF